MQKKPTEVKQNTLNKYMDQVRSASKGVDRKRNSCNYLSKSNMESNSKVSRLLNIKYDVSNEEIGIGLSKDTSEIGIQKNTISSVARDEYDSLNDRVPLSKTHLKQISFAFKPSDIKRARELSTNAEAFNKNEPYLAIQENIEPKSSCNEGYKRYESREKRVQRWRDDRKNGVVPYDARSHFSAKKTHDRTSDLNSSFQRRPSQDVS